MDLVVDDVRELGDRSSLEDIFMFKLFILGGTEAPH